MKQSPQPNFFIVGAAKTGTTSLYHYLHQHPRVFMSPIKEPCFFAPEVAHLAPGAREAVEADAAALQAYLDGPLQHMRDRGIVLVWEQYLKLFRHVKDESAVGEASVSYLPSIDAAPSIRSRIPDARIVMMLRDPAQRLFSHYAAARVAGATQMTFAAWLDGEVQAEAARRPPFGPVWTGRYAEHLQRYLAVFPPGQVRPYLYDDYVRTPARTVADIFTFLDVDPSHPIDMTRRHNVTLEPRLPKVRRLIRPISRAVRVVVPRPIVERIRGSGHTPPRLTLTADERAQAIDVYRADIHALATLIRRDLSAWLDPHRG